MENSESLWYGDRLPKTKEGKRLLRLIDWFCKLYAERYHNGMMTFALYMKFLLKIARRHGFHLRALLHLKMVSGSRTAYALGNIQRRLPESCFCSSRPILNLSLALSEICELEQSMGISKWHSIFMNPAVKLLAIRGVNWQKQIIILRNAILNEDWTVVGQILGRLPHFRKNTEKMSISAKYRIEQEAKLDNIRVMPYICSLFRVGIQYLMHRNLPKELFVKSAINMLEVFSEAGLRKQTHFDAPNYSLILVTELLIFLIANGMIEDSNYLIHFSESLPAFSKKAEIGRIFRSYRTLLEYEEWRLNGVLQTAHSKLSANLVTAVLDAPQNSAVFIEAMVHFFNSTDQLKVIMEVISIICEKSHNMLPCCYEILRKNELHREAYSILDMAISAEFGISASEPVLIEWVRVAASNQSELCDSSLCKICKILFEFLDYGENRTNKDAWIFLWDALRRISDHQFLLSLWESRKSWWRKFHQIQICEEAMHCKKLIFDFLTNLDSNSNSNLDSKRVDVNIHF